MWVGEGELSSKRYYDTYLVMPVILAIEIGRRYMMSHVPVLIDQACIVRVILGDLLLGQAEAIGVLEVAIGHIDELVDVFAAQRRLTMQSGHRRSHLTENHDIVLRHFSLYRALETL